MPATPQEFTQFKGLLPGLDRKRLAEPFVCDGANFIVDVDGPVSYFGKQWQTYRDIETPCGIQTEELPDGQTLYFLGDCLALYDEKGRNYYPIYTHAQRQTCWPWSMALVGEKLYFCNYELFSAQILEWDFNTGIWKLVADKTNMPETTYAVAESFGRLIVLSGDRVGWSAIENGTDFTPSTATGAGFQKLTVLAGKNKGITVKSYSSGFLVYTEKGIVQFAFTNSINPFRYDVLSRKHVLLNAWSVIEVVEDKSAKVLANAEEKHIILTARGLFSCNGEDEPELWQEVMSAYLHRQVLPSFNTSKTAMTTRLAADFNLGLISVSYAPDGRLGVYAKSYVYFIPSDEWGSLDQAHTGLVPIVLQEGAFAGRYLAMLNTNGTLYRFIQSDGDRLYPTITDFIIDVKAPYQPPWEFKDISTSEVGIATTGLSLYNDELTLFNDVGVFNSLTEADKFCSPESGITMTYAETDTVIVTRAGAPARAGLAVTGVALAGAYGVPYDEGTTEFALMSDLMALQACGIKYLYGIAKNNDSPLNAWLLIGAFRYKEEDADDFVTHMQEAVIGMMDEGINDIYLDYIFDFVDDIDTVEDWNTIDGKEDWGRIVGNLTQFNTKWIGTLDGYETWQSNDMLQEIVPATIEQNGKTRFIAGGVAGSYIYKQINANALGETFHLKHMKVSMTKGGRVF